MNGSAFRGAGAIGGVAIRYLWPAAGASSQPVADGSGHPSWVAELDLLYGRHRAKASERAEGEQASRTAILHVGMLHVPLLFGYRTPWFSSSNHLQIAAGPTLLQGLYSDIEIEVEGGTGQTQGLGTVDTTHLGATIQIATAVSAGRIQIPLELRGLWNPVVGNKTLNRLRNYQGPREPGALEANFDWQLLFMTGASF
jgi:hypothetical protein